MCPKAQVACPLQLIYANIHLIFVDRNIFYRFNVCFNFISIFSMTEFVCGTCLMTTFNNDGICLWHMSDDNFQQVFNDVDPSINYEFGLCFHSKTIF